MTALKILLCFQNNPVNTNSILLGIKHNITHSYLCFLDILKLVLSASNPMSFDW